MGWGDGGKAQNLNEPQSWALSVCPAALQAGLLWKENLTLEPVSSAMGPKCYFRGAAGEAGAPEAGVGEGRLFVRRAQPRAQVVTRRSGVRNCSHTGPRLGCLPHAGRFQAWERTSTCLAFPQLALGHRPHI